MQFRLLSLLKLRRVQDRAGGSRVVRDRCLNFLRAARRTYALGLVVALACQAAPAQSPEVQLISATFQSHSGEKVDLASVPLGAGPTSGDFSVQVNLTGQVGTSDTVQYAWCFVQNGSLVTHSAVGTYFTNGQMQDVSSKWFVVANAIYARRGGVSRAFSNLRKIKSRWFED